LGTQKAPNSPCTKCAKQHWSWTLVILILAADALAAFPFLTLSSPLLSPANVYLSLTVPTARRLSSKTIALTFIYQTTSFTSSPPAPNPLARARPLQSWEQHGTGTQHIAHHHLRLQLLVHHPSILHLRYQPILASRRSRDTELNYITFTTQYQRIARSHSTSPAHNLPEDAGAASASPTAARRQLRVARSYSLPRPRTTRARAHSNGATSAKQVGNALENSEAVCFCF
jgi:hypothetical protein